MFHFKAHSLNDVQNGVISQKVACEKKSRLLNAL